MKNELSRAMASADVKVRYDTQCKRVLSQKESLHGSGTYGQRICRNVSRRNYTLHRRYT